MASAASSSRIRTASVISISRRLARRPEAASALAIFSARRLAFQLNRRDVDGKADVIRPARRLGAGGSQHPFAELNDQAGVFRYRDEFRRRDHAAFGMAPAQQGFAAGHLVVAKIHNRLIVNLEAAVHERLTQILLHLEPGLCAGVHGRLEEAMGPAPVGLGAIHRQIGILDELLQIGAVARSQCDAYAGIGRELMAEALIRLPDRLVNSCNEFHDIVDVADICLNDRELVATKPRDKIGLPDAAPEASGHDLQQLIADMMPERIVDALELVDVDIKQRELLAPAGSPQFAFDLFAEQHPVRQIGQRVIMREVGDLLVGAPALGDVFHDVDDIAGLAGLIPDADALRGDQAAARHLAFPAVLVQRQAVDGSQRLVVIPCDYLGKCLREYIEGGLADDGIVRQADMDLGHPIDQHVTAIARIFHGDLRRYVVDDLTQEGIVPVAFLFEVSALRYVFHRRNPATLRQRPIDDLNRTSVSGFEDTVSNFSLRDVGQYG